MFEERLMPPKPEDELERLLAAEERAIRDDGFSRRVVDQAGKVIAWRRTAIFGSGLAGLGFALGGIVELTPHLPNITGWLDGLLSTTRTIDVSGAVQGASDGAQLAVVAVIAGITFLVTAVSLQSR
jgi:hypothetical protein